MPQRHLPEGPVGKSPETLCTPPAGLNQLRVLSAKQEFVEHLPWGDPCGAELHLGRFFCPGRKFSEPPAQMENFSAAGQSRLLELLHHVKDTPGVKGSSHPRIERSLEELKSLEGPCCALEAIFREDCLNVKVSSTTTAAQRLGAKRRLRQPHSAP